MEPEKQGFAEVVKVDALARRVSRQVLACKREWLKGRPLDEVALLNRVTASLVRPCPAQLLVTGTGQLHKQLYELHRRGKAKTDLYGADLAVTLHDSPSGLTKTAFFQLKKSDDDRVEVRLDQLDAARVHPEVWDRSFVVSANAGPGPMRVRGCSDLLPEFHGQATRTFAASTWPSLSEWLRTWLQCGVGPTSDIRSADCPERLLGPYTLPEELPAWMPRPLVEAGPSPPIPAAVWLTAELRRVKADSRRGDRD